MGTIATDIDNYLTHVTGNILEIGMDRGEGSSLALITLAKEREVKYVGVDMMEHEQWLYWKEQNHPWCEFHVCTGESFAENTNDTFGIVYLDNFDWDYWATKHNERMGITLPGNYIKSWNLENIYKINLPGVELTNEQSQIAHLTQIKLLNLDYNCVVICDDTWFDTLEGQWMGKCGAVVPYLQSEGFEVVRKKGARMNSYVILSRGHNGS